MTLERPPAAEPAAAPAAGGPPASSWTLVAVTGFLVFAWFTFLAFQVWRFANPPVISRPQTLSAPLIVTGRYQGEGKLAIDSVHWGSDAEPGNTLTVAASGPAPHVGESVIAFLSPLGKEAWSASPVEDDLGRPIAVSWWYPATPEVLRQFHPLLEWRRSLAETQ